MNKSINIIIINKNTNNIKIKNKIDDEEGQDNVENQRFFSVFSLLNPFKYTQRF